MKEKHGDFYYEINELEKSIKAYLRTSEEESKSDSNESHSDDDSHFIEIGNLMTDELDGKCTLSNIHVYGTYQSKGVGSKMLELAIQNFLETVYCCINSKAEFHLTSDGENFIAACLRRGILSPEICVQDEFYPSILVNQAILDYQNNPPITRKIESKKQTKITDFFQVISKESLKRNPEEENNNNDADRCKLKKFE